MEHIDFSEPTGEQVEHIEHRYLVEIVAYALTRADVYLEVCDKVNLIDKSLMFNTNEKIDKIINSIEIQDPNFARDQNSFSSSIYSILGYLNPKANQNYNKKFIKYLEQVFDVLYQEAHTFKGEKPFSLYLIPKMRIRPNDNKEDVWLRNYPVVPVLRGGGLSLTKFFALNDTFLGPFFDFRSEIFQEIELIESKLELNGANFKVDDRNRLWVSEHILKKNSTEFGSRKNAIEIIKSTFNVNDVYELKASDEEVTKDLDTVMKFVKNPRTSEVDIFLSVANLHHSEHARRNESIDRSNRSLLEDLDINYVEIPDSGYKYLRRFRGQSGQLNTYVNSLILDEETVLIPWYEGFHEGRAYNHQANQKAKEIYERYFEHVIQIPMPPISGSIHCLTLDVPDTKYLEF